MPIPQARRLIIQIDQPDATNHKAGWLGFGPDGYLYAALGDGGRATTPTTTARTSTRCSEKFSGSTFRPTDFLPIRTATTPFPPTIRLSGVAGADEIYALGLRNPWRSSFDRGLGDFYIADVGQGEWEEINIGASGANYGWKRVRRQRVRISGNDLQAAPLTFPIYTYDHSVGQSITGGYVYRGPGEGLQGHYFFGDFVTGKIFTLHFDGTSWIATDRTAQINRTSDRSARSPRSARTARAISMWSISTARFSG